MVKMIKSYWKIMVFRYAIIGLVIVMSVAVAYAASVPNTFTAGTMARASEVNSNFSYLAARSWERTPGTPYHLYFNTGKIGIGTSSPTTNLHIYDSSGASINLEAGGIDPYLALEMFNGNGTIGGIGDKSAGRTHFEIWSGSGKNLQFFTNTTGSVPGDNAGELVMVLDTNGRVGIGQASPSFPLHMASGAHVTAGGVWTSASSRANKENIARLHSEKAMEALKKLEPVTFNYKVDKTENHIGFIAEDVPELVATNDRKGLAPMDIVAVLTKVVQEQQKTLDAMSKELAELRAKVK
jgi:hypothetical protein